jgi:hypothetical protein
MKLKIVGYIVVREDEKETDPIHIVKRSVLSGWNSGNDQELQFDPEAYTGLYGVKGMRIVFSELGRVYPYGSGAEVVPINLTFPTDIQATDYVGLDDPGVKGILLSKTQSINLMRLRSPLMKLILAKWKIILGSLWDDEEASFTVKGTKYPHKIGALRADPLFAHLRIFTYIVKTSAGSFPVTSAYETPLSIESDYPVSGTIAVS